MTMQLQNLEIGENIGSATITGLTRNADGTLTAGTTYSLMVVLENINPTFENTTDSGSITPSSFKNNTKLESGVDLDLSGWILKNDSVATPSNRVRYIKNNYDYAQVVWSQAGVLSTYVGLIQRYKPIMNAKSFVKFEMNLIAVDIGGPNLIES